MAAVTGLTATTKRIFLFEGRYDFFMGKEIKKNPQRTFAMTLKQDNVYRDAWSVATRKVLGDDIFLYRLYSFAVHKNKQQHGP